MSINDIHACAQAYMDTCTCNCGLPVLYCTIASPWLVKCVSLDNNLLLIRILLLTFTSNLLSV